MKSKLESKLAAHQKEFHKLWEKHDKPHPNSNKYLALVKAFWYMKGIEEGVKLHENK